MANISITTQCNRRCRFCFASDFSLQMEDEVFERSLGFLEASGIRQLRILGGEPTLHPRFPEFLQKGLDRGLSLLVFSNGFIPEEVTAFLETISPEKLKLVVNTLTAPESRKNLHPKQEKLFRRLGGRILPGLTIDSPATDPDFLIDCVETFQTARTVRLGIAHPQLEGQNHYLLPRYYQAAGRKVAAFWEKARGKGISVEFDCGFVPCMFPREHLQMNHVELLALGERCNPILDILPDGRTISCFPLEELGSKDISFCKNDVELRKEFAEEQRALRLVTLFPDCADCPFLESGHCTGGCLAAALKRSRQGTFSFSMPHTATF
jgi:radical SAM protein with 4Fe4S-binding SPASM domain